MKPEIIYKSTTTRLVVMSSGRTATEEEKRQRLAKYVFCLYEIDKELKKSGKEIKTDLGCSKSKTKKRNSKILGVVEQTA